MQIRSNRWRLMWIDAGIYILVALIVMRILPEFLQVDSQLIYHAFGLFSILSCRLLCSVYRQIWRYGNIYAYMHLLLADFLGGIVFFAGSRILSFFFPEIGKAFFASTLITVCVDLLVAVAVRMVYHRCYLEIRKTTGLGAFLQRMIYAMTKVDLHTDIAEGNIPKTNVAIVGAGRVGVSLAEELRDNARSRYEPHFFIETDERKIGRVVCDLPVLSEKKMTPEIIAKYGIEEIIFAISDLPQEQWLELFEQYKQFGCRIKKYDYSTLESADGGRRTIRDFNIEELLFRKVTSFSDRETLDYYFGKTILVTGGGGSIGSELCRQVAGMRPKRLVLVDVYENGAYDIQQELRIAYGEELPLSLEILSVCDRAALETVFRTYQPEIVIHAAAHKHVPLMEHNCCEAIKNNVFGTLNVVELSEKYRAERFIMVSTDKAVNPTNVMGATKRMCEMIALSHAKHSEYTKFSATRFGNVLGSAGSVIPLFKKQIQNGGPITITDRRIVRYFMTIPEASHLVLASGVMAKNGELFVLDMGRPVKILEMAENMIRLSGFQPYRDIDIVETGLRPGEKLYEELLIRSEKLGQTSNEQIFIEQDEPISPEELSDRLELLRHAILTQNDDAARDALKQCVPTFSSPQVVNANAEKAAEMAASR